jgi:hypothetical protein
MPLDVSGLKGLLGEPDDERVGVTSSACGFRLGFGHQTTVERLRIILLGLSEVGGLDLDGLTVGGPVCGRTIRSGRGPSSPARRRASRWPRRRGLVAGPGGVPSRRGCRTGRT